MASADALVLDIGGDVGAVVVYADGGSTGRQLDLTPAGSARSHHLHNVVRRRTTPAGETVFAAVFPEVREGRYALWGADDEPVAELTVTGGEVSVVYAADCGRVLLGGLRGLTVPPTASPSSSPPASTPGSYL